jgi:hypothetical protein
MPEAEGPRRLAEFLIIDDVATVRGAVDLLCVPDLERWLERFKGAPSRSTCPT